MGTYRLIHVRNGAEIGRYVFNTITSSGNPIVAGPTRPLSGYTTFDAFTTFLKTTYPNYRDIPNGMLCASANDSVGIYFMNSLGGAGIKWLNVEDLQVDDRFYLNRWSNSNSYIRVSGKSDVNGNHYASLEYYTPDHVVAYGTTISTSKTNNQSGTCPFPWLADMNNIGNGYLSTFNLYFDVRDNGFYLAYSDGIAPSSLDNALKFWGKVKDINDIDSDPGTPTGGTPDFSQFEGDDIPMPGAPDESVSGVLASGFLNIYKPSDSDLRSFGAALWTNAFNTKWSDIDSVSNLILNAVSNPIDFIIGLFMLPVTPSVGATSGIYLGGINVNTISAPRVSSQYVTIDFGTINIAELYANYLDYSNSRVSIYLPYVGTADIDVQEITGGTVTLRYIVDVFTGACVANVQCTKITPVPWGDAYQNQTVHSYSGNMAIQLPISAGSFDTLTQGLINVGLGLGTNTPAIAMTGAKDVVQGFAGDVTTRGSLSSNTGKLGYQTPYLMFTRPIESRPANLGALHGYSAGVGGILSRFSGYVVCSDVKLDGVTATDSELNEIESILKSGVYV